MGHQDWPRNLYFIAVSSSQGDRELLLVLGDTQLADCGAKHNVSEGRRLHQGFVFGADAEAGFGRIG